MSNILDKHYEVVCERYGADNIFFMFLYGSQNYSIDTSSSDIDSKAVIFMSEDDIYWRHKIDSHIFFEDGSLCEVMDLVTFIKGLLNYKITLLECFITDTIIINSKYEDLFQEFLHLDGPVFDYNQKAFICELYEAANRDIEFYKCYEKEKPDVKNCVHGYRKILLAKKFLETGSYRDSIYLEPEEKEMLLSIKLTHMLPVNFFDDFYSLNREVKNAMNHQKSSLAPITVFQNFCRRAYKQYNSN